MLKLTFASFFLMLVAVGFSIGGLLPPLVPQALFALSLVMVLLNLISESDERRL